MDSIYTLLFAGIAFVYIWFEILPLIKKKDHLEVGYANASDTDVVKINVTIKVRKRWVPELLGLFHRMQNLGATGSSRMIGFYADGGGDFRPEFEVNGHPIKAHDQINGRVAVPTEGPYTVKEFFDAG